MRFTLALGLATVLEVLIGACTVGDLPLEGKACPCVDGFVCQIDRNVCMRPTPDASADGPSMGPDPAGPTNIHDHGTFETGCASWNSFKSNVVVSSLARSGSRSCEFCAESTSTAFAADDRGFLFDPPPGRYRGELWVRVPPGKPAVPVHIFMRTLSEGVEVERERSETMTVDETWRRFEVRLLVTKPALALNLTAWVETGAGNCVLVDDVAAYREP